MRRLSKLRARLRGGDGGFSMIELTISLSILAVTAAFFAAQIASTYTVYARSRERTLAEEIATEQLESARDLPYISIGTTPLGNPLGTIPVSQTLARGGYVFKVFSYVSYVNDPVPGRLATAANYKQVRIIVKRNNVQLADMQTLVAPKKQSSLTKGTIRVAVSDYYTNTPIPGVSVGVSGGPSAAVTDLTNGSGVATFAGLLPTEPTGPQSHYSISASATDYSVRPEFLPPAAAVTPTLTAGQTFDTAIQMFKTVWLAVDVVNPDGTPFPFGTTLTATAGALTSTEYTWGSTRWFSYIGGQPVVPGTSVSISAEASPFGTTLQSPTVTQIVPPNYPTDVVSHFTITMPALTCQATTITVVDTNGRAIPWHEIHVGGGDTNVDIWTNTDGSGKVAVPLPPSVAPYVIQVWTGTVVTTEVTQVISACGTGVVTTIPAPEMRDVTVTVHDVDGVRIPGAGMWIDGGDIYFGVWINVDANGTAVVSLPVSTAAYNVWVPAYDVFLQKSTTVTVTTALNQQLDITLERAPITPPTPL